MGDVNLRGFFITGTDTGVGKTMLTCLLARSVAFFSEKGRSFAEQKATLAPMAAYKPVCSGAVYREGEAPAEPRGTSDAHTGNQLGGSLALTLPTWPDIELLHAATQATFPRERICPQTFLAPLSPPAAAALEGREVDEALLLSGYRWLTERAGIVLVEGAGGFYSPISTNWLNADLAERIGLPVLIVAPNRLGTINHTLLTIEAVRSRGLTVAGVVLNRLNEADDLSRATNAAEIQDRGRVRIWGEIPFSPPTELQSSRLPESMVCELRNFGSDVDR
jgi:dethiobiotin synthetase